MITTLFIGTETKANGTSIHPIDATEATHAIKRRAAQLFGGYSLALVTGGWVNPDGELIEEMAIRLELVTEKPVREFAVWAGRLLEQSGVLFVEYGPGHYADGFVDCVELAGELVDRSNQSALPSAA